MGRGRGPTPAFPAVWHFRGASLPSGADRGRGPGPGVSCGLGLRQWQSGLRSRRTGWPGGSRPELFQPPPASPARPRDPRPLFCGRAGSAEPGLAPPPGPALLSNGGAGRSARVPAGGREGGGGDGRGEQSREAVPFRQARLISALRTPSGRGNGSRGAEIHLMINCSIRHCEPFPTFLTEGIPSRLRELLTE